MLGFCEFACLTFSFSTWQQTLVDSCIFSLWLLAWDMLCLSQCMRARLCTLFLNVLACVFKSSWVPMSGKRNGPGSKNVLRCTSHLYCSTPPICNTVLSWLVSLEERKTPQYTSNLCCNTPPVYTAVHLPFVPTILLRKYKGGEGSGKFLKSHPWQSQPSPFSSCSSHRAWGTCGSTPGML